MGAKLIAYSCDAPEHRSATISPDKLTVFQREWAFCAYNARAEGHRWQKTGGASYEDLMRHAGISVTAPNLEIAARR